MSKVQETQGDWIFIAPIGGLMLTDAVAHEFRISRVLFVAKEKLPRIRQRLGIQKPISQIKILAPYKRFFESADAFAVIRCKGTPATSKVECLNLVRDELAILAASQLGYAKRKQIGYLALFGEHGPGRIAHIFLNRNDTSHALTQRMTKSPLQLVLDGPWKRFQRGIFFLKLLKILNKETLVDRSWRNDLWKAAILIGRSLNTNDIPTAFLWNMIAVELLLTRPNDKYSANLPKRVEAFLGWIRPVFRDKISVAYATRCQLVHSWNRERVTIEQLLFTDDLLANLLMNLVSFPKLFVSKDKIIEFAERVECEQRLGLRPGLRSKVRPKLKFISRKYAKEDYEEI